MTLGLSLLDGFAEKSGILSFPFFWLCNANKVSTTPRELTLLQLEGRQSSTADDKSNVSLSILVFSSDTTRSGSVYMPHYVRSLRTGAPSPRLEIVDLCLILLQRRRGT